ncbi:unnamed protein product [Gongylonema pulchrum]|uniref:CRISPR-associated endonuclease Cas1 n=1 Tax=Gongylonema pulchrum TaxID=637853 RepID=A0A183D9R7_9BILA|nr:unnamed protein product [Gongylonema pulchrum]
MLVVTKLKSTEIGRIVFSLLLDAEAVDEMMSTMRCQKGENYLLYRKDLVPLRFHYAGSSRIGEVVIAGRPGVCIFL